MPQLLHAHWIAHKDIRFGLLNVIDLVIKAHSV